VVRDSDAPARPIGVFDSGVGGLSILRALRTELPGENFVYFADSSFAPYGERDDAFVIDRARHIVASLLKPDLNPIKALVVACNTATAAAIHVLRHEHPNLPIVGVEPALKPAIKATRTGRIGVLATRGTLASRKFAELLQSCAEHAHFVCTPCDGLASAIEASDAIQIKALCGQYICATGQFGIQHGQIDTLVLGCTHYPFASDVFRTLVGPQVTLIDNGEPVARQTRRVLHAPNPQTQPGRLALHSSGNPTILAQAAQRWLGLTVEVDSIKV